jgi:hypothetical protein
MSNDPAQKDRKFSRKLLQAISAEIAWAEADLPFLAGRDLADLKRILRGEVHPETPIDKKRAINALARSESSTEAAEILAEILSNPEDLLTVRVLAALNLSAMPPEIAQRALRENLASDDEILRAAIVESLSRIGGGDDLIALENVAFEDEGYRRQLALAKLAIGFRSGATMRESEDAIKSLGLHWTTHEAKQVAPEKVEKHIHAIWPSTYGIRLNRDVAFEVGCGKIKHILFLNEDLKRGDFIKPTRARSRLAGLVALPEEGMSHSAIRYLLFTIPSGTRLDVVVIGTNGKVAYAGEARPEKEKLRFTLRGVELGAAATEIEGLVSKDDIRLTLRVRGGGVTSRKRHGEQFPIYVDRAVTPVRERNDSRRGKPG